MSINELQDEVIAEFSDFDDWMDRYHHNGRVWKRAAQVKGAHGQ